MSERFAFIVAEHATNICSMEADLPTIAQMCTWLGVSKSGYYDWLGRPPSPAERRRELLKVKVKTLFELFGATYGYRAHPCRAASRRRAGRSRVSADPHA